MLRRYDIDIDEVLLNYIFCDQVRQRLALGQYIYLEGLFCLNHPKYIQRTSTGVFLTDYAHRHQDECCLAFHMPIRDHSDPKCIMCRPALLPSMRIADDPIDVHEQFLLYQEISSKVTALSESLPNNFSQMLNKLIESEGVKEEDLAAESNLSEKTIQRLRHHEPKAVTMETVVQLCIGLHLHPILSNRLLRAAGAKFMDTNLHTMYQFLIYTCYEYSVEACNKLLEYKGCPTLGKSKK